LTDPVAGLYLSLSTQASLLKSRGAPKINTLTGARKGEDVVSEWSEEAQKIVEAVRTIAGAFDGRDIDTLQAAHYQGPESSMIDQSGERVVGILGRALRV
jgi:hypothetical protein